DVGELAYVDSKKPLVLNFIREHPAAFAGLVLRRIAFTWTGFWSFRQDYLAKEPFAIPNGLFCSLLSLFAFLGVRKIVRAKYSLAVPLVMILLIYPLLYYLTHMGMDYRHGMDPALVVLIAYCFSKESPTAP
ncbi:MAG: hypothetical protein HYX73_05375, partial [Acidobacteria bacterium]|nr:hypothetical protein [Acidobacteriota bacterium]